MEKKPDRTALTAQLRTIPFLETLSPEAHRKLAETARWYTYETGAVIFWEGERPAGLYLVEYGWVRAYKSAANGREQVLHYAQAGETFNEIGAFASWQNPVTAVALEDSGIWILQKESLLNLLHQHPEFAQHIINKMGERVMSLVMLVADLSLRSVTARLARLILASAVDGVVERPRWFTQAELAARLGTVPDVVQRALRTLENDGLISASRRAILIQDAAGLAEIGD